MNEVYSFEIVLGLIIAIVLAVGIFLTFVRKILNEKQSIELEIVDLEEALARKQSKASQIGRNTALGDIHQLIGDFAVFTEYKEVIFLSTTSRQPSLDVIGVKDETLDFIEIKKKGAKITPPENKIRRLIEQKNVRYIVKDVDIPENVSIQNRELPKLRQVKQEVALELTVKGDQ